MSSGAPVQTQQQVLNSSMKLHCLGAAQPIAVSAQNSACWLPRYCIDLMAWAASCSVLTEPMSCHCPNWRCFVQCNLWVPSPPMRPWHLWHKILLKQEQTFRKDLGWLHQAEKLGKPVVWIASPSFSSAPSFKPGIPLEQQAIATPHYCALKLSSELSDENKAGRLQTCGAVSMWGQRVLQDLCTGWVCCTSFNTNSSFLWLLPA